MILNRNHGYAPLSNEEMKMIHIKSLELLENIGFHVTNHRIREALSRKGAIVEDENDIIKIPAKIVEECIRLAPSEITLCGRNPKHDIVIGGDNVHIGTGGRPNLVIDLETSERRPTLLNDIIDLVRLIDKLDNIKFCVVPSEATDIPLEYVDVNNIFCAICNTEKHIMDGVSSSDNLKIILQIAERIAGSKEKFLERPFLSIITNVISPLKIDTLVGDILYDASEYGIPITCSTAPIAGVTSPATLEGSLIQQNAESLFGVVVSQSVNPGTPYLYGASLATANFKNLNFLFAGIEMAIMNSCAAQMANYYKLPIYASAGPTDAKVADYQAGAEKALNLGMVALAGGSFLHLGAGLVDGGLATSYEQLVLDNDVFGSVYRVLKGLRFDDEQNAMDVIAEVGPGGTYLMEDHTFDHMIEDFYVPITYNRDTYQDWEKAGKPEIRELARNLAKKYLNENEDSYISEEQKNKILHEYEGVLVRRS